MRFLHLSDLHIGKKLNGFSLLEDQIYILNQALRIIDEYSPEAVIIAGDIYDTGFPPAAAVTVLDKFLTDIFSRGKLVFIVSGNHDSPERLAFGSEIMKSNGLYIEAVYRGTPSVVELSDKYGKLFIHMLPFVNPAAASAFYGDNAETFNDAVRLSIGKEPVNNNERNVLIAHQFVSHRGGNILRSDSELKYAGGLDDVNAAVFSGYDYVALGHLHCPQSVGRDAVVYGGSPLKYSISERLHRKCAIIADVCEKGRVLIQKVPFEPLRDLLLLKGPLEALLDGGKSDDYVSVILTGKERYIEPFKRLRSVYRNCISVEYEDEARDYSSDQYSPVDISHKSHFEIFEQFYYERNNERLDDYSVKYITELLDEISEGSREG